MAETIKPESDSYTLEKNKTETITITVTGGDEQIKLKSKDNETTDEDGEVQFIIKGKKAGDAKIRFETKNGKKATVDIIVVSSCDADAVTISNLQDNYINNDFAAMLINVDESMEITVKVTGDQGCLVKGKDVFGYDIRFWQRKSIAFVNTRNDRC